eukprot:CAMPEP_0115666012 /NCGR_PEP_ID=MMETSP0272-20121206/49187_1 /TAXON_ID=71861 /ORGANISM="Scrippsiella trochoidea, Strain CCMP3099" /LENGTH=81 /DNA_ID=CAMNT_0003104479 /DNA_START=136 /DNA_END=378 /DNA_ORIENTATION=-
MAVGLAKGWIDAAWVLEVELDGPLLNGGKVSPRNVGTVNSGPGPQGVALVEDLDPDEDTELLRDVRIARALEIQSGELHDA